jgi:hypothetical protein
VEFQIYESRKNNTKNAVNVRVLVAAGKELGFVAALCDGSGLIESADHERQLEFQLKYGLICNKNLCALFLNTRSPSRSD